MRNLPRLLRFLLPVIAAYVIAFSLLRLGFWWYFDNGTDHVPTGELLRAFYVGLKFDLRLTLLMLLPLFLVGWHRWLSPFGHRAVRNLWLGYLGLVSAVVLLFYMVDFGYYAYLQTRIDAGALRLLANLDTSLEMVWESYPIVILALLLFTAIAAVVYGLNRLLARAAGQPDTAYRWKGKTATAVATALLVLLGIYGKWSWYPLRWSDAFAGTSAFGSQVTLNPVLYFYDTRLAGGGAKVDEAKVRASYDTIARYLDVPQPDKSGLNFVRTFAPSNALATHPNVVVVIMESFAAYKSGLSGNPLDPTPYIDGLAHDGYYFKNFYVPQTGTARSVFCAVTGIPDVETHWTSTRNPRIVDQHLLINSFKGYDKFYFLGGSASWGNIRGLLSHNIPDLQIHEEGSYAAPRVDVWGISDLDLFREADKVFAKRTKPFFAIVQTSGNHRPYTIPDDHGDFRLQHADEATLKRYGFHSEEEYNSYRFMDYSVGHFIQLAKQAGYADNTIFAFFGDHGLPYFYDAQSATKADRDLGLVSNRVPFIIYSPKLIPHGETFDEVAGESDVMATMAALADRTYTNTTLGRDLFADRYGKERYAFTIVQANQVKVGLVGNDFYYQSDDDGSHGQLHQLASAEPAADVSAQYPEVAQKMSRLLSGYYETAKYMLYHNKPLPGDRPAN